MTQSLPNGSDRAAIDFSGENVFGLPPQYAAGVIRMILEMKPPDTHILRSLNWTLMPLEAGRHCTLNRGLGILK